MMLRSDIIRTCLTILDEACFVSSTGFISRELFFHDKHNNFYMIGSMGLATSIGVGISAASDQKVAVLEGDGSFLMMPGSLSSAVTLGCSKLVVIVIDNACYESTGGQMKPFADAATIASGLGLTAENIFRCRDFEGLECSLRKINSEMARGRGPFLVVASTEKESPKPRISLDPAEIATIVKGRFHKNSCAR